MVRINNVSLICEIDIMMVEYFTAKESAYCGADLKPSKKESPYILVNCRAAPRNKLKIKNKAVL